MSKHLGLNPYLPFWETVPDGEPHVFDGRIYIYGSHDKRNGTSFCEDDYVCWSAPVDDLGNWKYEASFIKKHRIRSMERHMTKRCRSMNLLFRCGNETALCPGCDKRTGRQILSLLCIGYGKCDFSGSL